MRLDYAQLDALVLESANHQPSQTNHQPLQG